MPDGTQPFELRGTEVAHSTDSAKLRKPKSKPNKPAKPHPDFPLFPYATKRWAKKVRGKLHYFGSWKDGPDAALDLWLEQKDELLVGRKPRAKAGVKQVSVQDACDFYLDHIEEQVQKGKRTLHWYQDVRLTCRIIKATIKATIGPNWAADSLSTDDFKELADRFEVTSKGRAASPVTTRGHTTRTRGMFNWLMKTGHVKTVPQYGVNFDAPSQNEVDNHRDDQQTKLFNRNQVLALLRHTKGEGDDARRMTPRIHERNQKDDPLSVAERRDPDKLTTFANTFRLAANDPDAERKHGLELALGGTMTWPMINAKLGRDQDQEKRTAIEIKRYAKKTGVELPRRKPGRPSGA